MDLENTELEEQERLNAEHLRLAEENKDKPYVDLWKQTRLAKEKQENVSRRQKMGGQ